MLIRRLVVAVAIGGAAGLGLVLARTLASPPIEIVPVIQLDRDDSSTTTSIPVPTSAVTPSTSTPPGTTPATVTPAATRPARPPASAPPPTVDPDDDDGDDDSD